MVARYFLDWVRVAVLGIIETMWKDNPSIPKGAFERGYADGSLPV